MKQLELTKKNFQSLKDCVKYDIEFMSSPFDIMDDSKKLKQYNKIPKLTISFFEVSGWKFFFSDISDC